MPRRSRSRSRHKSRSKTRSHRRHRHRSRTPSIPRSQGGDNSTKQTLESILSRLNNLEETSARATPNHSINETDPSTSASAQAIATALSALQPLRTQSYYVSNFDPSIHNIDVWFAEVDRAKAANNWNDSECLSRVAPCLKGDAKPWLDEWVSSDRSWTNFKVEFKSLCPQRLDLANILWDVMCTTSDGYRTYAEYARRSLLRLRIVKGLSDELMVQIIIRGIMDPQIKAAASNANLMPDSIVSFLSTYVKPQHNVNTNRNQQHLKRGLSNNSTTKCFRCGLLGHKGYNCDKKPRKFIPSANKAPPNTTSRTNNGPPSCTFCKKLGHTEDNCFAKNRSESRNQRNVNLCRERQVASGNNDITSAVVQGIPIDVLIDSGALNISLISEDVLKYFSCSEKPVHCTLKGISDKLITATRSVTLNIEFKDITIEADLVVVPASCMSTPIVIGTDVLNRDGIVYVRTKHDQFLTRSTESPVKVNAVHAEKRREINTPLLESDLDALKAVIDEYKVFFISGTATTTVKTGSMSIKLTSDTPVVYHPYKLSYHEKLKVREIVCDLKEKGIIRESQSQYASPILLVKKKDGTDRMCVDYRALNRITVKDRYPLPLIDDHIDRLGNFELFTGLDMATGFLQIPMEEESISKTAFVTPEGHFEYLKMPYGLSNSPIVYQRIINNTLRKFIDSGNVLVYVDDVLIMSMTVAEGLELLRDVLKTLTEAGFSINLSKCFFLTKEIEYLGRVVSRGQVRPSPRKVEALVNSPVPQNVKQVRQFLGLAGYFRRYIKDYSSKTACIARLTKKGVKFDWGPEQEKVRQELITCLTSEPILAIFDRTLATELHTDASSAGYGAVLIQVDKEGKKRVVAYFSKVTQGAESRYHSYELETLAVVKALQNFRHYLVGIPFKIITDCNALKSTERKKDLLPRVARWWIYLQDFDFTIEYRKGTMMPHADYLSRNPPTTNQVHNIEKPRNWAQIAQSADEETIGLIEKLRDGNLDPRQYVCQNDILYYRYTPVGEDARLLCYIPKGNRLSLLRIFHDEHEHIGVEKTIDLILKHFWFPGLRQFVSKYVSHCLTCISRKRVPRAPHQPLTSWDKPDSPFNTVHADVLGPLPQSNGYKFVFVLVDAFTKFCLLYAMYKQDVTELKRVFNDAISLFGVPKLLITDRGRMFESSQFITVITELGCDIHYITPEMHQSNGQAERYIRTVLNMIRIETSQNNSTWSNVLWKLQLVLNITKQKTTQVSPLNLLIGSEGTTPVIRSLVRDVAVERSQPNHEALREMCRTRANELLKRNQERQDAYVNRDRRPPRVFKINDLVFVIKFSQSTGKLDPGMRGPYKVTKVLPSDRYELKLLSGGYGKTTQAAAEYMVPWRGEWCPDTCAAFFASEYEQ